MGTARCAAASKMARPARSDPVKATAWASYGKKSGNPKCVDCMVHSGYEASAVDDTFGSLAGFARTVKATLFPS